MSLNLQKNKLCGQRLKIFLLTSDQIVQKVKFLQIRVFISVWVFLK